MMAAAGTYQSAFQKVTADAGQAVHAVGHFFDDPVLQKQPTAGLELQQYFLQRQGWAPIEESDVKHIQSQLVKAGFLDASEVTGVWTPASQQGWTQATSDHVDKQIHEGGGFSIGHVLGAFMPSHWIPALTGAVKALPSDFRALGADVYADMKSLPDVLTGHVGSQHYKQGMYKDQAHAINRLGGDTTPQEVQRQYAANQLDAINAVLTVMPIARGASLSRVAFTSANAQAAAKLAADGAIHDAAGVGFLRGVTTDLGAEAAQRGPGAIARSLYSEAPNGQMTGFFTQNPILRQMVPPVRYMIGAEGARGEGKQGLCYAFRTGLAQPYRLAGVQALGTTVQQGMLAGATERGIAAAESKIGGRHSAFDDQIYSQGTIGGTLGLALDMASGAFHGPLETAATRAAAAQGRHVLIGVNPSHSVGDLVQGVHQATEAFLRPVNIGWALNRGTKFVGAEQSIEDWTAKYGETFAQALVNTKLNQFAAAHYADAAIPADVQGQERIDQFLGLTHKALHDPAVLHDARGNVVSDLGALAGAFARDANVIRREPRDEYRRGLDALAQVWPHATALYGDHADELVTPLVTQNLAAAQQTHDFNKAMSANAPPKALPPIVGPMADLYRGTGDLGRFANTVHHEGNIDNVLPMLPLSHVGQNLSVNDFYFSNNPDLALGQGTNKGIRLELDAAGLKGQVNKSKPGWEMQYQQGDAEFVAKYNQQQDYQSRVRRIIINRGLSGSKVENAQLRNTVKRLRAAGWHFEKDAEGNVTLTRPDVTGAGPRPAAYSSYLRQNKTDHAPGSFGVARRQLPGEPVEMETQTQRQYNTTADQLQARLDAAGSPVHEADDTTAYDAAAAAQVKTDARKYLSLYAGKDFREMEGMDTQALIGLIRKQGERAPKDIDLPLDPSPELLAHWRAIHDAGFKPVLGTDIGHLFAPPVIDPIMVEGYQSKQRTLAEHMGLSTLPVSIKAAGTIRGALVERALQDAIDKGVIRVPPSITGARLHTLLLDNLASRAQLSRGESIAFHAARPLHRAQAEWIAGPNPSPEDLRDAYRKIEEQIAKNSSPLDATRKQIATALSFPQSDVLKDLAGTQGDLPFMDAKSAARVADVYQRAAFKEPAWAFGAGKVEDVFRAGFGFLGTNASYKVPVVRNIARLPGDLIKFRNRYRFQLDPMFSMRRVVKSGLKGSIEGAPMTVRPFTHMVEAGTLNHDMDVLNRVRPMKGAEGWDAMDRLAYEQDAFGIYNPRHHMALLAGELARQGMSDAEIGKKLDRAFTYGDRTAFERTISTFFYPFSFEKTLWRNVGSYMMDRPGQRLLVGAALQAYNALAQHDGIDQWLKDHAPVLNEFQKLNAFNHGIGPGAVGGINAQYAPALWNLFAPQKLGAMKEPQLNALMNVFPLMREVNSMLVGHSVYTGATSGGSIVQQGSIGLWGLQHAVDHATQIMGMGHAFDAPFHAAEKILPERPTTLTAAKNSAYAYRNSLVSALAPVLDYNYHHRGSEKIWGPTAPAAVRGQTISKGSIDDIVHSVYPDFDPAAAQSFAVTRQKEQQRFLSDLKQRNPGKAEGYQAFADAANKVVPAMNRALEDPSNFGRLSTVTQTFRDYAINMSEQDPNFLSYYNRFWLHSFGPLEAVTH